MQHIPITKIQIAKWWWRYYFPTMKKFTEISNNSGFHFSSNQSYSNTKKVVLFGDFGSLNHAQMPSVNEELQSLMKSADLIIGNQESVLTDRPAVNTRKSLTLLVNTEYYQALLKNLNIEPSKLVLNLANNHCYDGGIGSLNFTIDFLKKLGVSLIGYTTQEKGPIAQLPLGDMTIQVLAWAEFVNKAHLFDESCVVNTYETVMAKQSSQADFTIALPHWGVEFEHFPRTEQIQLFHQLVDHFKVDIVVGAHSHVIQPVEQYKDAFCFYSLGNFIFDTYAWPSRFVPALELNIGRNQLGEIGIANYTLHFYYRHQRKGVAAILSMDELDYFNRRRFGKRLQQLC